MSESYAIGIDLGTSMSCVAVMRHGKVEIIANDQGNRITPSVVAFADNERLVGEAAKNQAPMNPTNTVFENKRFIGRRFTDPTIQEDIKTSSCLVVEDQGRPKFQVQYMGQTKRFSPEEISAMILSKLKESAETYLGCPVKDVVITVPAYFSDECRHATKDAGTIAGLNVLRIINEPTAGSLAYGLDQKKDQEQNICVVDLGGGTSDFSILTIDEGVFEVQATSGDSHLGGADFDNCLVKHFAEEIKKKTQGKDIFQHDRALRRLKAACERMKKTLSEKTVAELEIDSLLDGEDFKSSMTRAKFEDLCKELFDRTLKPLAQVFADAKMSKNQIDNVVLIGGTTRIPKIQQLVKQFFNGKDLFTSINPDEAVAYGAAVQAATLSSNRTQIGENNKDLLLIDVCPLSLGVSVGPEAKMGKIIERSTVVPCTKVQTFTTGVENQSQVCIEIYEGERAFVRDNNKLGSFFLTNIPPGRPGEIEIEVTFEIDTNGILTVRATCKQNGVSSDIKVTNDRNRLSKDDIERLVREAEQYKEQDQKQLEKATAVEDFERAIRTTHSLMQMAAKDEKKQTMMSEESKTQIETAVKEAEAWLQEHKDKASTEDIQTKCKDFERQSQTILMSVLAQTQKEMPDTAQTENQSAAVDRPTKIEEVD